jgi:DegV family protein with EDD domain
VPAKIVTDSAADLPTAIVKELGITVVPAYVQIGNQSYRDGVDISCDELYDQLVNGSVHVTTAQPTPSDFCKIYQELSKETDEIISIQMSAKFSGTIGAARQGKELANTGSNITIIDSGTISMALGIMVMSAARLARINEPLPAIINEIQDAMKNTRLLGTFDTLKYLARGGRIGRAKALVGSVLNVKPLVTVRDGELAPIGNVRTRAKSLERLFDFVNDTANIKEIAVLHNTTPDEARILKDRLSVLVDAQHLYAARLGPAMGVHTGPGTMVVVVRDSGRANSADAAEATVKKSLLHLPKLNLPSHR